MITAAFDLGEELHNRSIRYFLHFPTWNAFNSSGLDLSFNKWNAVKYLNTSGTAINPSVNSLPNSSGGLYMFFVKCPIISGITEYPLYIGRAQFSKTQNLRKRVKEYFQHYARNSERPKITKMIRYWGSELFVAYYPLPNNILITTLEEELINSTLFAMNDKIPSTTISQAIKAF